MSDVANDKSIPVVNDMLFEVEVVTAFVLDRKHIQVGEKFMVDEAQFNQIAQFVSVGHPVKPVAKTNVAKHDGEKYGYEQTQEVGNQASKSSINAR